MQFKVPQNVQREDTIIGPLTLKQLIILGIGGGIAYAIYVSLAKTYYMEIWLPPVAIVGALTAAFAFLKIYNLPFHLFLLYLIEYNILPKKRIWIQGSAIPFISPFELKTLKQAPQKTVIEEQKQKKSLKEIVSIVDKYGKEEEINKQEQTNKNIIINK